MVTSFEKRSLRHSPLGFCKLLKKLATKVAGEVYIQPLHFFL